MSGVLFARGVRIAAATLAGALFVMFPEPPGDSTIAFPDVEWETRGPAEVGLDPGTVDRFVEAVGGDGVLVCKGYLVKSWGRHAEPGDWGSVGKPVASTLLLFAIQDGRVRSPDHRIAALGWDDLEGKDEHITLRHLANMVSGYGRGEGPGEAWAYNDVAAKLYYRTLTERIFGQTLDAEARERFAFLRIQDGTFFGSRGGFGLDMTPRDLARIGWFWVNRGRWKDRQEISESLFGDVFRPQVPGDLPVSRAPGPDYLNIGSFGAEETSTSAWGPGIYGWNLWWNGLTGEDQRRAFPDLPVDAFRADGRLGEHGVLVVPSLRIVVAARSAQWGFNPGRRETSLRLLVDAVRNFDPSDPDRGRGTTGWGGR